MSVTSPFTPDGARQISSDATTAYADVALDKTADQLTADEAAALVAPILAAGDETLQVEVGGPVATKSQTVAAGSEGIGLIAAAIILLITFGSVVAMGLPLLTALFGLGIAMALGEVLRRFVDVPEWAPYTAAMVGIGVGIDYALLIVTRFRSSLADGQEPRRATQTAIATAGRSVLFAGMTVVISMLGILLMGQPAMNGFAFTVVLAVLVVMAASVTLLPAVLGFAGRNIERLHVPFVSQGRPLVRRVPLVPLEPVHPAPPVVGSHRLAGRAAGPGGALPGHPLRLPRRGQRLTHADHAPGLRPARRRLRPRLRGTDAAHGARCGGRRAARVR